MGAADNPDGAAAGPVYAARRLSYRVWPLQEVLRDVRPTPDPLAPADLRELDPATMPRTRTDCLPGGRNATRPCRWLMCRHSLAAEGAMGESCALDVLDREGSPPALDAIGQLLGGVTRERVRQIEAQALRKLARKPGRVYAKLRSMGEP